MIERGINLTLIHFDKMNTARHPKSTLKANESPPTMDQKMPIGRLYFSQSLGCLEGISGQ